MIKKAGIVLGLAVVSFVLDSFMKPQYVSMNDTFTVAMDLSMPGLFLLGNKEYGYNHDFMEEYSDASKLNIQLLKQSNLLNYRDLLQSGQADVALVERRYMANADTASGVFLFGSNFVILSAKKNTTELSDSMLSSPGWFNLNRVRVSRAFTFTDTYAHWCALGRHEIEAVDTSFQGVDRLSHGDFDYYVCEKSEGQIAAGLVKNLQIVREIPDTIQMYAVFSDNNKRLKFDFEYWEDVYGERLRSELFTRYFERGLLASILQRSTSPKAIRRHRGSISLYDNLIKTICEKEGYDWRMVAAIINHESKFNEYLVSHRGARGLMQIMPVTARHFHTSVDALMDPETNIRVGIKLLREIERTLKLNGQTDVENRLSLMVACYNSGIGHIADARRLAVKYRRNPDSWEDVSDYLVRKNEYLGSDEVKCGRFNGMQTVAFVNNVLETYQKYCTKSSSQELATVR